MLVICHAQPGTSSAGKLTMPASLASPSRAVTRDAIPGHPASGDVRDG